VISLALVIGHVIFRYNLNKQNKKVMGTKTKKGVINDDIEASVTVTEKKSPGRPADPANVAAKAEKDAMRAMGLIKKGRPVMEGSKRQQRLEEREAKRANGELKKGRPKYTPEQKAAAAEAKAAKVETPVEVVED